LGLEPSQTVREIDQRARPDLSALQVTGAEELVSLRPRDAGFQSPFFDRDKIRMLSIHHVLAPLLNMARRSQKPTDQEILVCPMLPFNTNGPKH
jgi:hypothetical protein